MSDLLSSLDQEISRLQQVRSLLAGTTTPAASAPKKRAGRPPKKKHTMSAEGRARIAEAQRKRWAAIKKK